MISQDKELIGKLYKAGKEEVLELLKTRTGGLDNEEAAQRRLEHGKNQLPKPVARHVWQQLLRQFTHFMALLLWAAGIMAFIAGMPQLGWATWAVIIINAVFSFWQEYRADRALAKLAGLLPQRVKIYRGGNLEEFLAEDVVAGDIIFMEAGDHVPADCRIIEADKLLIDISMLTGESMPVERNSIPGADGEYTVSLSSNLLFAGTTITEGQCLAVAYAVGRYTEIGRISHFTAELRREKSTLEIQVERIVRIITAVAVLMGGLTFGLAVWWVGLDMQEGFLFGVGIIVANVPEGLLPTVSLALAIGVQRMAKQNALVRRLSAVETLSAVTVICTDKTGTLTENQLTVRKLWIPGSDVEVTGAGYEKKGEILSINEVVRHQATKLLTISVICSEANITEDDINKGTWKITGDPTEAAFLVAAAKGGILPDDARAGFIRGQTFPFDSKRKMMSVCARNISNPYFPPGTELVLTKGAPLEVLNCCTHFIKDGLEIILRADERQEILEANDRLANQGHRILAMAYREGCANGEQPESNLVFTGLAAMIDPPRPEVPEAISMCRQAGINIVMITGDYGLTAAAIGRKIGLIGDDNSSVITGTQVEAFDKAGLQEALKSSGTLIFARANPEHKLKIVEAYKALGHIVAVTGDGVNDAPALRSAHIGIAMGRGGTDVAREVSDMVLLDDNFATIIKAVEQGRAIYSNIRKFMTYILASNIPEMMPFMAMVFAKIPPALNILQILAVDLGTDLFPALALGAEKPEGDLLKRRPRKRKEHLLNTPLFARAYGFLGVIEGILSLGAFFSVWIKAGYSFADIQRITPMILHHTAGPEVLQVYQHATTMALAAIVACQIGNLFVCRSEILPFWKSSFRQNRLIWFGILYEIVLSAGIIYIPFLAAAFLTRPLEISDYGLLVLCPVILVMLEEARRYISGRFKLKKAAIAD